MATITVSASGGNYNATTTWIGGVVPVSTDDIVADATSGNLTINGTYNINNVDFTNYLGTLSFSFSTGSGRLNMFGTSITFNPTMSVLYRSLGQGINYIPMYFGRTSGTMNISANGLTFSHIMSEGGSIKNFTTPVVLDCLYNNTLTSFDPGLTGDGRSIFNTSTYQGDISIINGYIFNNSDTMTIAAGSTMSFKGNVGWALSNFLNIQGMLVIDCGSGTFSCRTAPTGTMRWKYISGNLDDRFSPSYLKPRCTPAPSGYFETSGMTWSSIFVAAANSTMICAEKLKIDVLQINPQGTNTTTTFTGINGADISNAWINKASNITSNNATAILFENGATYSFGRLIANGTPNLLTNYQYTLRGATASGTKSNIIVSDYANLSLLNLVDLNAPTPIYVAGGAANTLTRTTGFTTTPVSGGGGGGSFTFVN